MRLQWMFGVVLLVPCLFVSLGCGGGASIDTVPVSGVVTLNGKPLPNVGVTLNPKDKGHVAIGQTDAQGKFASVTTLSPGDGAAPGEYVVTISEVMEVEENIDSADAYSTDTGALPFPTKYLNTDESDAIVTVGSEATELDIALVP